MTYLTFHLIFTIPLFIALLLFNKKNSQLLTKKNILGTVLLIFLAVIYTTPWDSYLIKEKIWSYKPNNILFSIYLIPIEEYFFFIIQTMIGCLLTLTLLKKTALKKISKNTPLKNFLFYSLTMALTLAVFIFSSQYVGSNNPYRYLSLITIWATPILFLQWFVGQKVLLAYKRELFLGVGLLTFYFWFADSVAISQNIWSFQRESISGIHFFGILPIEEALFFFVTNCMVVQGFILFTRMDLKEVLRL